MVVDEMCRFYGLPDREFLDLPISRFWGKYKGMNIIQLREKADAITNAAVSQSKDLSNFMYRLNWQLEQLTGDVRADDTSEWKKKYGKKKKRRRGKKGKILFRKFKWKTKKGK